MAKHVGIKTIINGQKVECKIFSTRKAVGSNTFSKRVKCKGKDMLSQHHARKVR